MKRSLDDEDSIVGNLKKMAYSNTSLGSSNNSSNNDSNSQPSSKAQNNGQSRTNNGNTIFKPTSIYLDGVIINGEKTLDIMIPGNKVGFIIGKSGDMIRQLQERANVKMVIIQQSSEVTDSQKQLRITGEPNKVDYAQQLVKDLLVEKEMEILKYKNKAPTHSNNNEYGSVPQSHIDIPVSPQYIGLVIGKNGDNIKRISQETGAKVTVDVSKTDANGNKLCQISGLNLHSVNAAAEMVNDILNYAMNNKRTPQPGTEEVKISVPQNKTGIVIGKGGITLRSIKQQCGCNIELEKNSKGIFNIRGPADRIPYAQQLIGEKIGGQVTVLSSTIQNSSQQTAAAATAYADPYSWTQYAAYPQVAAATAAPAAAAAATQDSNAAAWAAYYSQYYAQMQQMGAQTAASTTAASSTTATTATTTESGQQPEQDYSAAWAQYYAQCYSQMQQMGQANPYAAAVPTTTQEKKEGS